MQYIYKFWIGTFNERFLSKGNGDYNIQTLYILLTCIYLQFEGSDNQTRLFFLSVQKLSSSFVNYSL